MDLMRSRPPGRSVYLVPNLETPYELFIERRAGEGADASPSRRDCPYLTDRERSAKDDTPFACVALLPRFEDPV